MGTDNLIVEISGFLNICATGRKILDILEISKRGLLVSEIIERTKRSERAVRTHLKLLLQLRLIRRKKVVTKKKEASLSLPRTSGPRADKVHKKGDAPEIAQTGSAHTQGLRVRG